ncbi:MAG: hypothetical protein LBV11_07025 [Bacillus cereus]|jgi:hypothetical protein|nr:hypothetical protein [Bacillus cereus]
METEQEPCCGCCAHFYDEDVCGYGTCSIGDFPVYCGNYCDDYSPRPLHISANQPLSDKTTKMLKEVIKEAYKMK